MKGKHEKSQALEPCQGSNEENSSLLNVPDIAGYLKVQRSTIYSLVETKQIPHYRVGRQIRFKKPEIEKWLEERKEPAVDVKTVTKRVIGSLQKRSNPRIKRTLRKIIDEVKGEGYTVDNGKPDQTGCLREEVHYGSL